MAENTVTRSHLAEAVYQEVGLSRNESADLVDIILEEVSRVLVRGEMVKLSSFGSFQVRSKGQRIGRNPKNRSGSADFAAQGFVFRASHVLKDAISRGMTGAPSTAAKTGED